MADFRELDARTYRQQLINEGRFADHLLSIMPPRRNGNLAWGECDPATASFPMYKPDGIWFVLDAETLEEIYYQKPMTEAAYIASLHELADKAAEFAMCYFIGGDEGPIKIGHSVNVADRLRAFQMGCPVKLKVYATAPGGEAREAAYHWQFQAARLHGEWFERTPELVAEIERLTSANRVTRIRGVPMLLANLPHPALKHLDNLEVGKT